MKDELQSLRNQIDEINMKILELLNERAVLSKQVGLAKIKQGKPLFDPKREQEIIEKLMMNNKGPYENRDIDAIFKVIFKTSLELQEQEK